MFIHKGVSTAIRNIWLPTIRFHCAYAQYRTAILQSQYHKNGPIQVKIAKNVQSIFANSLTSIQNIQKKLDFQRQTIIKEKINLQKGKLAQQKPEKAKLLQDYYELYKTLMKSVQKCPLSNDWVYKIMGWYNMLPFYKTLVEKLIESKDQQQLLELLNCLCQMKYEWDNPYGIIDQSFFKQKNISTFYRNLQNCNLQLKTVQKIEKILIVPLNLSKRIFFNRYFNQKIDHLLKYLQVTQDYTISDIIWLMHAYVRYMNDEEQGISFLEKYLISHRPTLSNHDIQLLIKTYELKGRINRNIYQLIIKPYILRHKMATIQDLVDILKFTICSESQDTNMLKNLYELISIKYKQQKISTSRHLYNLHLYTHYLKIKGYKIKLPKKLEEELQNNCKQRAEGRENASVLIEKALKTKEFDPKVKKAKYKSPCLQTEKSKIVEYEETQKSVFEKQFSHKLRLLNLSDYKVYQKPVFCCFQLDYFLVHKLTSQSLDIQIQGIQYVFASGRLIRQRVIRDQILAHYNIKINHLDYNYVKTKSRFDEDQLLMNKRIRTRQ